MSDYEKIWGGMDVIPVNKWQKHHLISEHIKNKTVLEIGPGIWPKTNLNSHFLDLSQSACKKLKSKGGICVVGSISNMPYASSYFDMIVAFEVLEHVNNDVKAIKEVHRVLKENGLFALSVPINKKFWTKWDDYAGHVKRYEFEELLKLLKNNGFNIKGYFPIKTIIPNKIYFKYLHLIQTWFFKNFEKLAIKASNKLIKLHTINPKNVKFSESKPLNYKKLKGIVLLCEKEKKEVKDLNDSQTLGKESHP